MYCTPALGYLRPVMPLILLAEKVFDVLLSSFILDVYNKIDCFVLSENCLKKTVYRMCWRRNVTEPAICGGFCMSHFIRCDTIVLDSLHYVNLFDITATATSLSVKSNKRFRDFLSRQTFQRLAMKH